MSQNELACIGKIIIVLLGYYIGTGLIGVLFSADGDSEIILAIVWGVGGVVFALLATCI
mgnify:CR=1 FL=1